MSAIGIVAALPAELRPLTRGWAQAGGVLRGRIGEYAIVAAAGGMGAGAVSRACERILAAAPDLDTLVSVGYAGSLSCGLRPPDACAIREVVDAGTGERFTAESLPGATGGSIQPQRLVTLDHVAGAEEKRRLAEAFQATLVDMEAAAVARFAAAHSLRFLCCKAVTDGPNERLPDFNRFSTREGQLRMTSLIAWALVHPGSWGALRRLGQNSRQAAEELSNFVSRSLSGSVQ
jgi:adenosylhomocysteine nucleosidase